MLQLWEVAVWGVFGGIAIDGIELVKVIRAHGGNLPPDVRHWPYWFAEFLRLAIGGGFAIALNDAGQINGAFGALAVGAAAPLIAEKLSQTLPLPEDSGLVGQREANRPEPLEEVEEQ